MPKISNERYNILYRNFHSIRDFRKRGFGLRRVEYFCKDGLLIMKMYFYKCLNFLPAPPCKRIINALLSVDPLRRSAHTYDIVAMDMSFNIKLLGTVRRLRHGGHILVAIGSNEAFREVLPLIREVCSDIVELVTPIKLDCDGVELIGVLRRYRSNPPFGLHYINLYEYSF